ncbi:MAG: SLBB domain-containing protein [Balneolales bacterium]
MFTRAHGIILLTVGLLLSGLPSTPLQAQQTQEREQRTVNVQMSQTLDQYLYIDELGLNLALDKFYEGMLDIETYILGVGDLLGISLEGNVTGTLRSLRVNSQGTIMIPEAGLVHVKDLLFQDAETVINQRISEKLPGTRASLFLEQPRSIKIHLVGNIPYSGPHLVPAQTRLDQAIYHAFFELARVPSADINPSEMLANKYPDNFIHMNQYALRNITIQHDDGSRETGDLIRYLQTGDMETNPIVREGDIIHINRFYDYNPRISISGAVNRPLEMGYRHDDSIERLIRMAGGTNYDASETTVRVVRIIEQGLRDVVLDDSASIADFTLQPNDRVVIPFDRNRRSTQNVIVHGEAQHIGRFPIRDGETTMYELLELTGGFTDQALPRAAYLLRSQPAKTEYGTRPSFEPEALRRTSDQYTQGFEYLNLEAQLIQNRVYIDLTDDEQLRDVKLFDGDRLFIPKNEGTVFVFGQVNNPGYYNFEPEWTSGRYIDHAGGFALSADEDRIFIVKSQSSSWYHPGEAILEPGDLIFVDRVPFDELQAARGYDLQKRSQRNSNIQLVMTGLTTITSIITAYIAVTR